MSRKSLAKAIKALDQEIAYWKAGHSKGPAIMSMDDLEALRFALKDRVTFGFCSYADRTFEMIVADPETREETTLVGKLRDDQFELVDRLFPTCVMVTKAIVPKEDK